jgi:hypothetical protein
MSFGLRSRPLRRRLPRRVRPRREAPAHRRTRSVYARGPNTASLLEDTISWFRLHAQPPSRVWIRPSSQNYDPTPDLPLMENLLSFGGKGTDRTTLQRNHPVRTKRCMCLSQPSSLDRCHHCEPSCIGSKGLDSKSKPMEALLSPPGMFSLHTRQTRNRLRHR